MARTMQQPNFKLRATLAAGMIICRVCGECKPRLHDKAGRICSWECQREQMRRYAAKHNTDPEKRAAAKRRKAKYRAKPETRKKETAYAQKYRTRPGVREKERAADKRYRDKPEVRRRRVARNNEYSKERRKQDPAFAATLSVRCLVGATLRNHGKRKTARTADIIGYPVTELQAWARANGYRRGMHIDHIVPVSWWLNRYPNDFRAAMRGAWRLSNLRVIPARENMSKGARREFLI